MPSSPKGGAWLNREQYANFIRLLRQEKQVAEQTQQHIALLEASHATLAAYEEWHQAVQVSQHDTPAEFQERVKLLTRARQLSAETLPQLQPFAKK